MSLADFKGFDPLRRKLARVMNLDPMPLLRQWGGVLIEDNRAGVLSGLDKDGNPLKPVKYRTGIVKPTKFRTGKGFASTKGAFKGFGPLSSGLHGNLTSAQYKLLTGPPLAPRGDDSRVITNFKILPPRLETSGPNGGSWVIEGVWLDVVSRKGRPFLHAHFEGLGHLPKRNLRGLRPVGRQKAMLLLRRFVKAVLSQTAGP